MWKVPDIDFLVAIDAILRGPRSFDTVDFAEWVRRNHPHSTLGGKSNSQIGRYLSKYASMLLIESAGAGTRGHRWQRRASGQALDLLRLAWENEVPQKALQVMARHRPAFAAHYHSISTKLQERASTTVGRVRQRRTPREPVAEMPELIPWDDQRLAVRSDPVHRRRYRALQSWYRETRLRVPPGRNSTGRLVGSMLDRQAAGANPGLNFLDSGIAAYVDERLPEVVASGGTAEADRLRRNMLSSQPLCFNIFGALRQHPSPAARVLADVFDLPVHAVEDIVVEFAPLPVDDYLGDRTAFDAIVSYRTEGGSRGFVGVETKYTEPFSPTVYTAKRHPRYAHWTKTAYGFRDGAAGTLEHKGVNQLWRNTMLAVALRERQGFAAGHVAVLACEDDPVVSKAVDRLEGQLLDRLVRTASYEQLVDRARMEPDLAPWALAFETRYVDLTPVGQAFAAGARLDGR